LQDLIFPATRREGKKISGDPSGGEKKKFLSFPFFLALVRCDCRRGGGGEKRHCSAIGRKARGIQTPQSGSGPLSFLGHLGAKGGKGEGTEDIMPPQGGVSNPLGKKGRDPSLKFCLRQSPADSEKEGGGISPRAGRKNNAPKKESAFRQKLKPLPPAPPKRREERFKPEKVLRSQGNQTTGRTNQGILMVSSVSPKRKKCFRRCSEKKPPRRVQKNGPVHRNKNPCRCCQTGEGFPLDPTRKRLFINPQQKSGTATVSQIGEEGGGVGGGLEGKGGRARSRKARGLPWTGDS